MKRPIRNFEQEDAFTRWRRVLFWQPGELRRVKRREAKLERRRGDAEVRRELREWQVEVWWDELERGECQHGCNGSPCGSGACSLICHVDVPGRDDG